MVFAFSFERRWRRENKENHDVKPELSDAVEENTSGFLSLHRETKFIIGFDFAVTLFFHLNLFPFFST